MVRNFKGSIFFTEACKQYDDEQWRITAAIRFCIPRETIAIVWRYNKSRDRFEVGNASWSKKYQKQPTPIVSAEVGDNVTFDMNYNNVHIKNIFTDMAIIANFHPKLKRFWVFSKKEIITDKNKPVVRCS